MHTFQPKDPIEAITEHGAGIVMFITVYGPHANDLWCIATKSDGRLRHYQTTQVRLAESGVLEMNEPKKENGAVVIKKAEQFQDKPREPKEMFLHIDPSGKVWVGKTSPDNEDTKYYIVLDEMKERLICNGKVGVPSDYRRGLK